LDSKFQLQSLTLASFGFSPLRFAFDDYDYYVIICEPNKTIAMVSLEWFVFVCVLIWQHFRDFISTERNI